MHIVSTVQYIGGGRRAVEAEGWMEYIASGKAEVLYRWKAGWSTTQMGKAEVLYTIQMEGWME